MTGPDLDAWWREGVAVLPGVLAAGPRERLRSICDRALERLRERGEAPAEGPNVAFLTEPGLHDSREDLVDLLEAIASPDVLGWLAALGREPVLFHNTQYFYEPASRAWTGIWHRDTQFSTPDDGAERERIASSDGIHVRFALVTDDHLEIVPGSHARWDVPAERAARKGADRDRAVGLDGARRIELEAGDACVFHAWSIHRGRYRPGRPRRTLDLVFSVGAPERVDPPPPTCFGDPEILRSLGEGAHGFFRAFVDTYGDGWG